MPYSDDLNPSYRALLDAATSVAVPHETPNPLPRVANLRFIAPLASSPAGAVFARALRDAVDRGGRVLRFGNELEVLLSGGDVRIEVAPGTGYLTS